MDEKYGGGYIGPSNYLPSSKEKIKMVHVEVHKPRRPPPNVSRGTQMSDMEEERRCITPPPPYTPSLTENDGFKEKILTPTMLRRGLGATPTTPFNGRPNTNTDADDNETQAIMDAWLSVLSSSLLRKEPECTNEAQTRTRQSSTHGWMEPLPRKQ